MNQKPEKHTDIIDFDRWKQVDHQRRAERALEAGQPQIKPKEKE